MPLFRFVPVAALLVCLVSGPARADFELSGYFGLQGALSSDVEGEDPGGVGDFDFNADWEGRSFEPPIYWGVRGMYWTEAQYGFGVEFTHAKVYADNDTLDRSGFDVLEFTDGLNILTANVMRRFPEAFGPVMPYVGGGLGVSIPYVEVASSGGETFEYQLTGPAVRWVAGISYPLSPSWSVFGEYQGTFSSNRADLDNGGDLRTDILTNALNLGVSFNF